MILCTAELKLLFFSSSWILGFIAPNIQTRHKVNSNQSKPHCALVYCTQRFTEEYGFPIIEYSLMLMWSPALPPLLHSWRNVILRTFHWFSPWGLCSSIVALEFHLFLHSRLGCLTYFRISIFFFAQFPTQVGKLHIRLIFTYVVVKMVCLKDRYSYNP